jgi:AcrR family transcriptional regulator
MNSMSSEKRRYTLKTRADRQAETRQRIVEAAVALHQEVGPARTTVSEIARRAGVQRLTVYNNFPDERGLFAVCQGHFLERHPPPDPAPALGLEDPRERVQHILGDRYAWYRATEAMSGNVQRDRSLEPALDSLMSETWDAQIARLATTLGTGFTSDGNQTERLVALICVALDFWTWKRLAAAGMNDSGAAELMADAIAGVGLG